MRKSTTTIFDDYLPKNTIVTSPVLTSTRYHEQLGKHDALAIQVVVDNITPPSSTSYLCCFLEHSSDGRSWIERNNQTDSGPFTSTSADINMTIPTTAAGTTITLMWSDACQGASNPAATGGSGPLLAFVRWRLFFGDPAIAAHVRILATQRDL